MSDTQYEPPTDFAGPADPRAAGEPFIDLPPMSVDDLAKEVQFLARTWRQVSERVAILEQLTLHHRHRRPIRGFAQRTLRIYWHHFADARREYGIPNWRVGRFWLNFNHPELRNGAQERAWHVKKHVQPEIGCEWSVAPHGLRPTHSIGLRFEAYNDHDWTAHIELFDLAFYVFGKQWYPKSWAKWLAREPKGRERSYCDEREISLSWFEGTLRWRLYWPTMSWSRGDPEWRSGHWNPMDFFFGQPKYQSVLRREDSAATIDLPEYRYPCRVQISDNYWTRPRRFLGHQFELKVVRAEVEFTEYAPPHAGKGENSWDCDDDATYSITMPVPSGARDEIEWAREAARASIMATRKKTGDRGTNWNWRANPVKRLPADRAPDRADESKVGYLAGDGDNHLGSDAE